MSDKTLKEHIVSFRIPKDTAATVEKMLGSQPVVGVKSINQFSRKVLKDLLTGKLVYKNAEDISKDPDIPD